MKRAASASLRGMLCTLCIGMFIGGFYPSPSNAQLSIWVPCWSGKARAEGRTEYIADRMGVNTNGMRVDDIEDRYCVKPEKKAPEKALSPREQQAKAKEELRKQQEAERQAKLAEQKKKSDEAREKKLEAERLAKENAEKERQRKAEEAQRYWAEKREALNREINERAKPTHAAADNAVQKQLAAALQSPTKPKEAFHEAVIVCKTMNDKGGFKCEGPNGSMSGSPTSISGYRSPQELVSVNMVAGCPELRPIKSSGREQVFGCGFAATGANNARDISPGDLGGRKTFYCQPGQFSCRDESPTEAAK